MTYDARERSADQARPVEIYTFRRQALAWRYTSANRNVVVAFQTYATAPIERTDIEQGSEINRSGIKVTVPRDFEIAMFFAASPPSDSISLTIQQYHEGDSEIVPVWSGRVLGVEFEGSKATLSLEPSGTSIRRNGLRRVYSKLCTAVLYACGVNREAFRVVAAADAVSGVTVTAGEVGTLGDGYFNGGYIEYLVGSGVYDRRDILSQVGAVLTLNRPPSGLSVGGAFNAYPGCDHTLGDGGCPKFSNVINYAGQPYLPEKNPFGNDPIY